MFAPSDQYSLDEIRPMVPQPHAEIIAPGDPDEVLREQLEELINHRSECSVAGCPRCTRYSLAQALLLALFV